MSEGAVGFGEPGGVSPRREMLILLRGLTPPGSPQPPGASLAGAASARVELVVAELGVPLDVDVAEALQQLALRRAAARRRGVVLHADRQLPLLVEVHDRAVAV